LQPSPCPVRFPPAGTDPIPFPPSSLSPVSFPDAHLLTHPGQEVGHVLQRELVGVPADADARAPVMVGGADGDVGLSGLHPGDVLLLTGSP